MLSTCGRLLAQCDCRGGERLRNLFVQRINELRIELKSTTLNASPAPAVQPKIAGLQAEGEKLGLFKYVFGGLAGGLLGIGTGVAAFGTAISGVGPGIAVGLLTIKAFSGGSSGQPLDDAGRERVRLAVEEYTRRLEQPAKKPPRKRVVKTVVAKPAAPKKTAKKEETQ